MCSSTVANTCSVVKARTLLPVELVWGTRESLALGGPPLVMAIVNVTPDSFYDRGLTADPAAAVTRGMEIVAAGADLLDIGGMTAQPGELLPAEAEVARVVPVVQRLRERTDVPKWRSTPTGPTLQRPSRGRRRARDDHTGLSDPDLAAVVAAHRAGLVVTHLGLRPRARPLQRRPGAHAQLGRPSVPADAGQPGQRGRPRPPPGAARRAGPSCRRCRAGRPPPRPSPCRGDGRCGVGGEAPVVEIRRPATTIAMTSGGPRSRCRRTAAGGAYAP